MKRIVLIVSNNALTLNFWYQFVDAAKTEIRLVRSLEAAIPELYLSQPDLVIIDDYFNSDNQKQWIFEVAAGIKLSGYTCRIICLSPEGAIQHTAFINLLENTSLFNFTELFRDQPDLLSFEENLRFLN